MLKHNEVNPLAVFGLRRMEHFPPHFTAIKFDLYCNEKHISDWIWEHLDGRFYLGDEYSDSENKQNISIQKLAGFESPGEASYFSLILDTINKRELW
jgi:hypothetical protein